jgi:hypothetical protein
MWLSSPAVIPVNAKEQYNEAIKYEKNTFWAAESGKSTPPIDLVGGTILWTNTRSNNGMSFFADMVLF